MADEQNNLFRETLSVIRGGDFDKIVKYMTKLGYVFTQAGNKDHLFYVHPKLKGDRHFSRSPGNLYRPHGKQREETVGPRDRSKAKQSVEALKALVMGEEPNNE